MMLVICNLVADSLFRATSAKMAYNLLISTNQPTENLAAEYRNSETANWKLITGLVLERDLGTAFNRVIPYVPKNHPSDSYGEANREVIDNGTSGTGMKTDRLFLVEAAI
jgi:hypothetical protein